jgi:hypothetical protein
MSDPVKSPSSSEAERAEPAAKRTTRSVPTGLFLPAGSEEVVKRIDDGWARNRIESAGSRQGLESGRPPYCPRGWVTAPDCRLRLKQIPNSVDHARRIALGKGRGDSKNAAIKKSPPLTVRKRHLFSLI